MKWKSHAQSYKDALVYMRKMQQGQIQSFKTPWKKINDAGIGGFEYNSITIIAARPGGGKTLMKDQMIREGFKLNKGQGIRALEFQLEMVAKNSKIREFSSVSKQTYKYLLSAETEGVKISDELLEKCAQYARGASKYPIDIIDDPVTPEEFRSEIIEYMDTHAVTPEGGIKIYCQTIVTLDHSVLLKKMKNQSVNDKLNMLGEVCTELKKKYPIAFIILSQLNRDIENPTRCENGKYGNYPTAGDIFGADALNQHADMLIVLDIPALRHITTYGPDRYIIEDDTVLVAHVLKTRTGDRRMSFFKAEFHNMNIADALTPPQEPQIKKKS